MTDPSKHGHLSTRLSPLILQSKLEMAGSQIPLLCSAAEKTEAQLTSAIKMTALSKSHRKLTQAIPVHVVSLLKLCCRVFLPSILRQVGNPALLPAQNQIDTVSQSHQESPFPPHS